LFRERRVERSGISSELFKFALQGHFDFLIVDSEHLPLFAVEFDGKWHQTSVQEERDAKKDALCKHFGLPILRIDDTFIEKKYRNMDILTWMVEAWFLSKAFDEAQSQGQVSPMEPFDPCAFITVPGLRGTCPLFLSAGPRMKIRRLFQAGRCLEAYTSEIIGRDDDGVYRAIGFIRLNEKEGVYVTTAMRSQHFPIWEVDLLIEIVPCLVYDRLSDVLNRKNRATSWDHICSTVKGFQKYVRNINVSMIDAEMRA
jgi:very-short-patch-repair endonuclease